ncbi:DUF1604-domain-containing protein [Annulohypoxylon truncatum]|uniref:DUF1604-domain-containing protein n=1 Tax=Annulohypoxylon truncatum TaxID=327061 RepID=UPI002008EA2D|nr:DUF1604-domain-containing protein [Annulohypoxylon truncatum]KAI1204971.1 DUF1604-domain-containing protein [Annulohypoxylon truncatum]
MSQKRSRKSFEDEFQDQESYVVYGTPLPPLDPDVRDDGSYVPVWKQEVRDERGRKRLHGAFTGGWSAGYFNTVGSKEGWTPSTFVSSRVNRRKDDAAAKQQRPEDFMDEEDLADAEEARKLQTAQGFAGLGSTDEDGLAQRGGLTDLFRVKGDTMGKKLLRKMGWKDGQGIGPKVRRKARLEVGGGKSGGTVQDGGETYLFAPDNVSMISFNKKLDRKGLGHRGESRLAPMRSNTRTEAGSSSDEDSRNGPLIRPNALKKKKPSKFGKGGIGIGVLNDTGSDDEDPYEIGPRISYNRVIGGDKKKKKAASTTTSANPALRSAPVFISRKHALAQAGKNLRKCHDGRLPLDGFVFGTRTDDLASSINSEVNKYPPPTIPPDWKPSKQRQPDDASSASNPNYVSTADAARASNLDPRSRAALLGEAQLQGKSVFDFLSASARERLASATGKPNLPPALGEIPAGFALSDAERRQQLLRRVPELDKATAAAAIARGASGGGSAPYADDEAKRGRYRRYLEWAAGFAAEPPAKAPDVSEEDYLRELHEFRKCALIFKPMTGAMASRFTTSTSASGLKGNGNGNGSGADGNTDLVSRPPPKPADPAEQAARLGMYGSMTRSTADFYPTRLLCKRFNVKPPAHVQPDQEQEGAGAGVSGNTAKSKAADPFRTFSSGGVYSESAMTLDELVRSAQTQTQAQGAGGSAAGDGGEVSASTTSKAPEVPPQPQATAVVVNAEVNEVLEGKRAEDDVLKAIFGDSSDDED